MAKCPACKSQNVKPVWDGDTGIGDPHVCQDCNFYFDWYEIRKQLKRSAVSRLERLAKMERAIERFPKWRQDLTDGIALMDGRGRRAADHESIMLWEREWDQLRGNLLSVAESIEDQIDNIEGH